MDNLLDDTFETVERFQEQKWPMPWLNAMDPAKDFEAEIIQAFDVYHVPRTILVDESRRIASVDPSLQELENYLKEHLVP